jgi:ADP-ribose pyrophosphatase YjhB (NUDIX family)
MKRPEVAVGVILFDEWRRVLLIQRGHAPSKGSWSVPGGRVEGGETLLEACARELKAETGLSARLLDAPEVVEYIDAEYHYVILDYVGTDPKGTLRAGEDAADARFVPLAEVPAYETTAGLWPVLERAYRRVFGAPPPSR